MATFTVGPTSPGSQSGAYTGLTGSQVTLTQSGTLQSISIFWNSTGINFLLGLYSDAGGGVPGTLLASSALAVSANGLNTLAIVSGPTLSPGTYWLFVQNQSGCNGNVDNGGLGYFQGGIAWTGSLPTTPPSGITGSYTFSIYATFQSGGTTQRFPMAIADTSTVTALRYEVGLRIPLTIADTSTVTALRYEVGLRIPMAIADTSTVTALGYHVGQRFALVIASTSTVALGFHISLGQRFSLIVTSTSTVALGFQISLGQRFPVIVTSTSTVTLGFHVNRRFALVVADTSTVVLGWSLPIQHFPLQVADTSTVIALDFENDYSIVLQDPLTVAPYAGQNQQQHIHVPAVIWHREEWEEGPWVLPPYAAIFPEVPNMQIQETLPAVVPPPIQKTDLWAAMQTWPL